MSAGRAHHPLQQHWYSIAVGLVEDSLAAEGDTPVAEGDTLAAEGDTPVVEGDTPVECWGRMQEELHEKQRSHVSIKEKST